MCGSFVCSAHFARLTDHLYVCTASALLFWRVLCAFLQHIIGQQEAKRAVAIALRNRWRRMQLPKEVQAEIMPKNMYVGVPAPTRLGPLRPLANDSHRARTSFTCVLPRCPQPYGRSHRVRKD